MEERRKPTHEIREGAIKVSIWANQTAKGVWHKATVRRLYTVKNGAEAQGKNVWRSTDSFSSADIPLLIKLLDLAAQWMREHDSKAEAKAA